MSRGLEISTPEKRAKEIEEAGGRPLYLRCKRCLREDKSRTPAAHKDSKLLKVRFTCEPCQKILKDGAVEGNDGPPYRSASEEAEARILREFQRSIQQEMDRTAQLAVPRPPNPRSALRVGTCTERAISSTAAVQQMVSDEAVRHLRERSQEEQERLDERVRRIFAQAAHGRPKDADRGETI